MQDKGISFELDSVEYGNDPDLTPERHLWVSVIVLALEDLDSVCRQLNEKLVPFQSKLIMIALTKNLTGKDYWTNRHERKNIARQKAICKRELYKHLYDIDSKWFECVCHFAGVSEHLVRKIARDILNQKIKTRFSRGDDALREKLNTRRRKRYRARVL